MCKTNHCPVCKGTGETKITVTMDKEVTETSIKCIHCNNTPMSKKDADKLKKAIEREDKMWCKCGNKSDSTTYHKDTKKIKHHWTCNDCGKILQMG